MSLSREAVATKILSALPNTAQTGIRQGPIPLFTGLDTLVAFVYSTSMKWLVIPILFTLNGCAVYTVASGTSLITTGKSVGDHVLSNTIPNADCSVTNLTKDKYYCEVKDISQTYNRTGI